MNKIPQHYLANFMGMPKTKRYDALMAFHTDSAGFWGYGSFLKSVSEILSTDVGLFGNLPQISDAQLAQMIKDGCKSASGTEYKSNLYVAKLLRNFASENGLVARRIEMPFAKFGSGEFLRFWHNIIAELDGKRYVLCVDPKIAGLTKAGQKVVASVTQHAVIDDNAKLTGLDIGILTFPKLSSNRVKPVVRGTKLSLHSLEELYSYDELRERYLETYSQYAQVIKDIRTKGQSSGTTGTLI